MPALSMEQHKLADSETDTFSDEEEEEESVDERACPVRLRALVAVAVLLTLLAGIAHFRNLPAFPGSVPGRREVVGVEGAGPQCGGEGRPGAPSQHMHLHFLMMAMYEVPHTEIWHDFFRSGAPSSFSAWVHCKDADKCKAGLEKSGFSDFTVIPSAYNAWCEDLVSPMLQLLKFALAENIVSAGADEKFIFISHQSLPLKPIPVMQAELGKHPEASDFCFLPSQWWFQLKSDNQTWKPVASQWSILSKRDAKTLLERMPEPAADKPVSVPEVENTSWDDFQVSHCIDEGAIFSTIFGLFHLERRANSYPGIGQLHIPESFLQGCCRTLGFQQAHLTLAEDEQVFEAFAENTDIGKVMKELVNEPGNDVQRPITHCPLCEILWTVNGLNAKGLQILRRSPFLFMRKFAGNASLPGFASIFAA